VKLSSSNIILLIFFLGYVCIPQSTSAQLSPSQYSYPNLHIPWYTVETEHFRVHFQEGNSRSAKITARIAEKIYPDITNLYNFEPDTKTDIVLNDRQDYSNGAAYFFDNQIEIWIPSLNTPLRGTHDWLWDVITHEFTHIVQLQVAMKKNRRIPAIYFQWLSYSDVRRPDVLYGYPKGIITYPFASINVPAWLAEGVAQYQRSHWYYDYWDSHRDMLLRTALLADDPIGFEEMGIFGSKNALERERIYNQGFAFTSFLVDRYGEEILLSISKVLAQSGTFSVNNALKEATGVPGKQLFEEFVRTSASAYRQATESLEIAKTNSIESNGFFNFYPKVSPTGDKLAYLSNKNHRTANTQLFIESRNGKNGQTDAISIGNLQHSDLKHRTHPGQDPVIKYLQSSYSFAPNGSAIAFSRQKLNSYGEQYNDLFVYNLESNKVKRLTHSQRLSSPAWHPSLSKLAAIQQSQGSTNIVQVDPVTGSTEPLTSFHNGEQVYTPTWHPNGERLYFSSSDEFTRNIYRVSDETHKITPVLKDSLTDYRDPYIDDKGQYLYYAADPDGIFNIYRIPLKQPNATPQKLTSVLGGAFMPHLQGNTLYFSQFKADGYKISSVKVSKVQTPTKLASKYNRAHLEDFKLLTPQQASRPDLDNISAISTSRLQQLDQTDSLKITFPNSETDPTLRSHKNTYTSFSFYPVVRFDNYSKKNGSNGRLLTAGKFGSLGENLLRDMKVGTYFVSREVTDRLDIYGGAMFGLASEPSSGIGNFFSPGRLTDLDRDLFLITEYQGLPFIEKRWSPTISIELYNLRRNVANGLSVEEFPCTSCLPDTTKTDIAYTVWEADIFLRSKINDHNMIELGAGYSPYRVQTDGFFSQELQQFIPSSSSEYFRGTTLTAAYVYEDFVPYPNSDVAPIGMRTAVRYTYEPNKLLEEYEIQDGTLSPIYRSVKNHSLETNLRLGYPVSQNSVINFYGRGFSYFNNPDDFFYLDYVGGFSGMRSYPYFAIGGNTTALTQLSYTFPVIQNINQQVGRHTLDKLYLRLFAETGNGWKGPLNIGNNLKTGAGAEIRFAFNSYYLFPLKLFVSGAYGFNEFDVTLPDEFITETTGGGVQYGQELIFHFGLTFDFNVLNR
jgi:Tol biopolymer transport system component